MAMPCSISFTDKNNHMFLWNKIKKNGHKRASYLIFRIVLIYLNSNCLYIMYIIKCNSVICENFLVIRFLQLNIQFYRKWFKERFLNISLKAKCNEISLADFYFVVNND